MMDDITWKDAWDADDVVKDLSDLANEMMKRGRYEDSALLNMVALYIMEKEDAEDE